MKLLLALIVLTIVAASFLFDYLWKRWVATQREIRERDSGEFRR